MRSDRERDKTVVAAAVAVDYVIAGFSTRRGGKRNIFNMDGVLGKVVSFSDALCIQIG